MINDLDRSVVFHRIPSKIHILSDGALRNWLKLLMNHGKSFFQRVIRVCDLRLDAVDIDLAFIHFIDSEKTFHQCRFSGTVLSHQCVDRSGANP